MTLPLMPKATAVWLVENTALTFDQIAAFCGLHPLEVQAIADEEVAVGIVGRDPIVNGELTREEIARCENDPAARLEMAEAKTPRPAPTTKGPRYTPVAKRQERPDAIAWLLRHYPELSDAQISRLIGTTKNTINAVRDRTHWKGPNIKPVDPVDIGMCSYEDLLAAVQLARKRKARAEARAAREAHRRERAGAPAAAASETTDSAAPEAPETPAAPAPPPEKGSDSGEPDIESVFGERHEPAASEDEPSRDPWASPGKTEEDTPETPVPDSPDESTGSGGSRQG